MPLFGGDPRLLAIEVILQFNRWYDVLCIPILIFHQMNMLSYVDGTVVGFIQIFFEVARVLFISSYKKANIPNFMLFLIITLPFVLVFDFVWMFAIRRVGPLIQSILIGFIIQHLLEIILGLAFSYKFHKYQGGFYQFSRVRIAINDNLNDDRQSEKT